MVAGAKVSALTSTALGFKFEGRKVRAHIPRTRTECRILDASGSSSTDRSLLGTLCALNREGLRSVVTTLAI